MKINIESIPHKDHRYPTCGDWWIDPDGTIQIRVSEEMGTHSQELVAVHELAEVLMCMANGVSQEDVDRFDMDFEKHRHPDDTSEPGDHAEAPYCREHGYATAIERIMATHMGVEWLDHEKRIEELFDEANE